MWWRVDHEFTMHVQPAAAQAMFVRDIAPGLHRLRGFSVYRDEPGELALGDGRELATYSVGERGGAVQGPGRIMRRLTERRIHVRFEALPEGTRVRVRGGAEADVRKALGSLGQPGQWPETAPPPDL